MTRAAIIFAAVAWSLCGSVAVAQGTQPQSDQPQSAQPSSEPPPSDQPQITEPPSEQQPSAPRDPVAAMIGAWEFSNADHDKICRFNFRSDSVSGGYKLDVDKSCPSLFPSTKEIVSW